MKLGNRVQINIGVADLETALACYQKLDFQLIDRNTMPNPWAQLSDGQNLLLLNQDGNIYVGLGYFSADASDRVAQMEAMGIEFLHKQTGPDGQLFMAIFADINGLAVALINHDPTGMHQPAGEPCTKCGKFGEFSLAVKDFSTAAAFWNKLGFKTLHESPSPYQWGILYDGMIVLGLHQTSDFAGINITYFAPDMADRLSQLKQEGFTIKQAGQDASDKIGVLVAPDGEQLFLVQGEIGDPPEFV